MDDNLTDQLSRILNNHNVPQYEKDIITLYLSPDPKNVLLHFIVRMKPDFKPEAFHAFLCREFTELSNWLINYDKLPDDAKLGQTTGIVISAPPQVGKSTIISEFFPAWHLGREPKHPILMTSYGQDLIERKSQSVRDIIEEPEYSKIFPATRTRQDSRAKNWWFLSNGVGYVKAAGIDGTLTGTGGRLAIVDDPSKNFKEATSTATQEDTWTFWTSSLQNRVWAGGATAVLATRWSDMELLSRIINNPGYRHWKYIRIPAIAENQEERDAMNAKWNLPEGLPDPLGREEGESIAPIRMPIQFLLDMKEKTPSIEWQALYQGAPGNVEGNMIKKTDFDQNMIEESMRPKGDHIVRILWWDKAGSKASAAKKNRKIDYTAGVLLAYDNKEDKTYIEYVEQFQEEISERDKKIYETTKWIWENLPKSGVFEVWHEQEPGSAGKDVASILDKMLAEFPVDHETSTGDKYLRGTPFIKACNRGRVYIVKDRKWNKVYIDQLLEVPTGKYDDMYDASALAYNKALLKLKKKRKVDVF